jgi:alkylation response protein AidB-like acyl-CoA dehydrogenase
MNRDEFFQEAPRLANTYRENRWLAAYLKKYLPREIFQEIDGDLAKFGEKCAGPYWELARQAEREKPEHVPYGAFGRRIDEIRVSQAWQELHNISAREGLVQIAYQRKYREHSRLYQFAKLYLFHPSSAFFTCPLAMCDGAAKVLELYGKEAVHQEAFRHLTSNKPEEFWTSGQWMTEKTGGSDVSGTSTVAVSGKGEVRLHGVKWFSSATTSAMALALARYEGAPAGSKGLTLFLVPMYQNGGLNNIQVLRLKDKLGTWALPTAELELKGTLAYQVGEREQGVKTVASMLNITRLYNAVCSVGQMTRALDMLRDYSSKRQVFGATLDKQPLHTGTFAQEQSKLLAGFLLTMEMVRLLGKDECGEASANEQDLLRLFTPIAKMFTAKTSIQVSSEVIEGFGGAGYVEDSGVAVHLRDSQVFTIWEGATNVLSLDLIRVVQKSSALTALQKDISDRLKNLKSDASKRLQTRWQELERTMGQWIESPAEVQAVGARDLAFHLAWHYGYTLLLSWSESESAANQTVMAAWLQEMEGQLGKFTLKTSAQCQNSKLAFSGQLEV